MAKNKFKMPSSFTVLAAFIAVMAILTWVVPVGRYETKVDEKTEETVRVGGTYKTADQLLEKADQLKSQGKKDEAKALEEEAEGLKSPQAFWEVLMAPGAGFKDAVDVVFFVIIIGGFLAVQNKTGSIQAAFGSLLKKLKGREKWIIPALFLFFSLGGTVYGMQEETVAFYPIVIPIMIAAGFNAMTAVMTIVVGYSVGLIGSTINPFSTGIASGFANVSIGDGQVARLVIWVIATILGCWFVMDYAKKVKAGQFAEDAENDKKLKYKLDGEDGKTVEFNGKRKVSLAIFILTFVILILSVIPWEWKFNITFFADLTKNVSEIPVLGAFLGSIPAFGDWWFFELSALFLIASIVTALAYGMSEEDYINSFIDGAKDILAVALIIAVSRGITVVMGNGHISATILYQGEMMLTDLNSGMLAVLSYLFFLPMSLLVPSTSGLATLTMPILGPLANFSGMGREIMVTAFSTASGLVQMLAPTVGSLMGGLLLAKVSYGKYLKRVWKFAVMMMILSMVVLFASAML